MEKNVLGGFSALLDELSGKGIDAISSSKEDNVDDDKKKNDNDRFKIESLPEDDEDSILALS